MDVEVFDQKPEDFFADVEVGACYLEHEGRVLLLQNSHQKNEAGKWGLPAGKKEENECTKTCAKRELMEETGIGIDSIDALTTLAVLYYRKPSVQYLFHIYKIEISAIPSLTLSDEHQDYIWASKEDLQTLPLMIGAKEALSYCQGQLGEK